jgi:Family of unknown function (DUF6364)
MTNLTLTVDENLLRQARIIALQRGTSVNAMVREFLAQQVATVAPSEDRVARFKRLMKAAQGSLGGEKFDREAMYKTEPRMQRLSANATSKPKKPAAKR